MAAHHIKRFSVTLVLSTALSLVVAVALIWSNRTASATEMMLHTNGTSYFAGVIMSRGRFSFHVFSAEGEFGGGGFAASTLPPDQVVMGNFRFYLQNGVLEVGAPLWLIEAICLSLVVLCYRRNRRKVMSRGFPMSALPSDG